MNDDIYAKMNATLTQFSTSDDPHLKNVDAHKIMRAERRANALNAVQIARVHAGRSDQPYSQSEADVIMAIMELLDKVAGQ